MLKFLLVAGAAVAIAGTPAQAQLLGGVTGAVNGTVGGTLNGAVNGTLRGALHLQGREYAVAMPFATSGLTASVQAACHPEAGLPGSNTGCVDPVMMWGPQLHRGLVYATDMIIGLWVVRLKR